MRRIQVITIARLQKHNHRDHRHEAIPDNNNPTDESNVPHAASLGCIRRCGYWTKVYASCEAKSAAADWSVRSTAALRPTSCDGGPAAR
jgi:hypothetical protein